MKISKILVPTDFSDCSKEALHYAIMLLKRYQGELVVLHVLSKAFETYTTPDTPAQPFIPPGGAPTTQPYVVAPGGGVGYVYSRGILTYPDPAHEGREIRRDLGEEAREKLRDLVPVDLHEPLRLQAQIRVGDPYPEILDLAREYKVDMIVMGTHGRTGLSHLLIGSVAEHVIQRSPIPVLTVRSSAEAR